MAIEATSHDPTTVPPAITPRRLWFGFATSAFAWVTLGVLDIIVVWRTCARYGHGTGIAGHEFARGFAFGLAVLLLLVTLAAGFTSYRNWRSLSQARHFLDATATDRREFMALLGVFISITLGAGIVWLSLGPLIITACQRAK